MKLLRQSINSLWHYEFIGTRKNGRQWRVADANDDFIGDFATEKSARETVREHNKGLVVPASWQF